MAAQRTLKSVGRLIAVWLAASALMASEYRGTVKSGGLAVPGATVVAVQGDKKLTTVTDSRGAFRFADLIDGTWTIEVEMLGFEKAARQVVAGPQTPAADWELKLLSLEALVAKLNPERAARRAVPPSPAAQAPRRNAATPDTFRRLEVNQSAQASTLGEEGAIRSEDVANLSQSAANSFIVQGSVSSALGLAQQNDWGFGGRGFGMDLMGPPGMEGPGGAAGMQGEAGLPGTGPAASGRGGPGEGGQFAGRMGGPGGPGGFAGRGGLAGRGGPGAGRGPDWQSRPNARAFGNARRDPRNSYMAMAFFSLDNSAWDARSFSVTGARVDKPSYAFTRAGAMFGGPLRIPKLIGAEKQIFFMFNFNIQRNRTGAISEPVNMPSALERAGDFSQTMVAGAPVTIYDPTTGTPFPGNKIPASRISSASSGLLSYFPNPNLPFAARNYQTSWSGSNNSHNLNARVSNIRLSSKDRLNGDIGYQGSDTVSPNVFQFIDAGSGRGMNAGLGWSRSITARLINTLHYTFSRNRQLLTPYFAQVRNVAADLNIAGTSQDPMNWGPPNLSFVNYAGLSDGNYSLNRNQTSSIRESLMWIRGSHRFTFGADYRRQQFNQLADTNGRGTYSFNGSATSAIVDGVAQNGSGYDLADFLLGLPTTGSIRYGNAAKYFRGSGYGVFINNDWRIRPDFTINGGLRWDYATPITELYGRMVNLDVAPGFAAAAAVLPGQTGPYSDALPNALIHPDRNNFSPRLGFAWRPLKNASTVVRGGYGLYYNTSVYNVIAANMAQQPPFAQVLSATNSAATPLTIENGFLLASTQALTSTYAIDPYYRIGYAQTWSISIQNDLPFGMFGTVGYLGTKGTRLDQQFIPNSVAPGAAESLLPHGFIYQTSNGNSIYHAAQFQLVRRFRSGIGAHAAYQFSKSIDNAGTGGRGQGGTPVAQNWTDYSAERGLSSFDARHNLTVQLQYSTGMGTAGGTLLNGWKGALAKDWTIGGNISVRSGSPFTAVVGGNRSQVAGTAVTNTVRANATGLPVDVAGMLFNTAAFSAPASGQWGNAGRNTIPGPTTFFLNASLGRVFRMGERRSADLQLQAQNVLNQVTITSWGTLLGSNNYGLATGAAGMRRITANLRFRF